MGDRRAGGVSFSPRRVRALALHTWRPQCPAEQRSPGSSAVQHTTLPVLIVGASCAYWADSTASHTSFTYFLIPPKQTGALLGPSEIFSWEEAHTGLDVGSGPFGKEFWGPGYPEHGGWYGCHKHIPWVDRSPVLRQGYSQTKEQGFLEHGLSLPGSQGGTDEIQSKIL